MPPISASHRGFLASMPRGGFAIVLTLGPLALASPAWSVHFDLVGDGNLQRRSFYSTNLGCTNQSQGRSLTRRPRPPATSSKEGSLS